MSQQKADEEREKRKAAAKESAIADGIAVECGCCFDQEAPVSSEPPYRGLTLRKRACHALRATSSARNACVPWSRPSSETSKSWVLSDCNI